MQHNFDAMKPLFSNVYVQPLPETQKSSSDLNITNGNLLKGKVVAVGDDVKEIFTEGDIVLYESGQGNKFSHQGKEGAFFDAKQLICIL